MNELLFFLQTIVSLVFTLVAFRLGYTYLVGLIAGQVVLMNIFVVKQMTLFGFVVTGGNVLYASIFLGTDLLAEHYGKEKAYEAVRIGFCVSLFFLIMSQFILKYTPFKEDIAQPAFITLFTLTPRIVLGSMAAYLLAQHADVFLFHKILEKTGKKWLWLRNNGSTFCSQLLDTVTFTLIAFLGVYPNILMLIISTYIIKIIVAMLDTPFIYLSKLRPFTPELIQIENH